MTLATHIHRLAATAAAVAMLGASLGEASAMPFPDASLTASIAAPAVEKAAWCRWNCGPGWGWRGSRWGYWGPAAVVGGIAAGAVVGAALLSAPPPAPVDYGPCWRRVIGPYGGVHWQRVC